MTYFHALWTAPKFHGVATGQTTDIALADFEALTWLVSILEVCRHSPMGLITDQRGREFAERTGLAGFYNHGIRTDLDEVPADILPKPFWNAGKVFAWLKLPAGSVQLDTDAILWQPLCPQADVLALHTESSRWPVYARNRERYARHGFSEPDWDWSADALNTALWHFRADEAARECAGHALRFMANYSIALRDGRERDTQKGSAVVFAGQHVLAMAARRAGLTSETVGKLLPDTPQLARNPVCSHLWMSKNHYRVCAPARRAYCLHLLRHVREHFPEALPLLERWKLREEAFTGDVTEGNLQKVPPSLRKRIRVLATVPSQTCLRDANLGAIRPARAGTWLLPGEELVAMAASGMGRARLPLES